MRISIVLPSYNEKDNIEILIPEIENLVFKEFDMVGEIIIVDDSSTDGTIETVKKFSKMYGNIKLIQRGIQKGIGSALREGYDKAKYDVIVSSDSDLSYDTKDIVRLIDKIKEGYDVVVGSRHLCKGSYETPTFNIRIKGLISKFGNILVRKVMGIYIHDFSANFRAINRDVWNKIETKEKTNSILLEMIVKAYYKGYKVTEIPIKFKDRIHGESKLKLGRESVKYLFKLMLYAIKYRI